MMTSFVADTHALVWHLTNSTRLGRAARHAFAQADRGRATCQVPAIALVEISLIHERGRIRVGVAKILEALAPHPGWGVLPLDIEQTLEFAALPAIRDPMDRLVVAAARATGSRLISADAKLDGHGVERVWE